MFEKFFTMIRTGVKNAILGGIADAQAEIDDRITNHEPLMIEGEKTKSNGRRKAAK